MCDNAVRQFITQSSSSVDELMQHVSLLCIGEVGKKKDLSSHAAIHDTVLKAMVSGNENVKTAAATTFGCVAGTFCIFLLFLCR